MLLSLLDLDLKVGDLRVLPEDFLLLSSDLFLLLVICEFKVHDLLGLIHQVKLSACDILLDTLHNLSLVGLPSQEFFDSLDVEFGLIFLKVFDLLLKASNFGEMSFR